MGTVIVNDTADASASAVELFLPVEGACAIHLLNTSLASACRNLAPGYANRPATVVGAPELNNGFYRTTGNLNFFELADPETEAMTWIHFGRAVSSFVPSTSIPILIGNFTSTGTIGNAGTSLFFTGNDTTRSLRTSSAALTAQNTETLVSAELVNDVGTTNFAPRVLRVDATRRGVDDLRQGRSSSLTTTLARSLNVRRPRIGSGYSPNYGGVSDCAGIVAFPRYMTDDEMRSVVGQLKIYFLAKFSLSFE